MWHQALCRELFVLQSFQTPDSFSKLAIINTWQPQLKDELLEYCKRHCCSDCCWAQVHAVLNPLLTIATTFRIETGRGHVDYNPQIVQLLHRLARYCS